jgi:hypothetical protein
MNIQNIIIFGLLLAVVHPAHGALHCEISGGAGIPSPYRYFETLPETDSTEYLTFDPINGFCANARLSIDVWDSTYRIGITSGFVRRYKLTMHRTGEATTEKTGEVLSIPLIGFLEGRRSPFFYEFGLGPSITRFNYADEGLPEFSVTSLFGFLFGGGYEHALLPNLHLLVKGELLVYAPVFLVDYLDKRFSGRIEDSRYPEYNVNEFQMVTYIGAIQIGLQYDFGGTLRLPIDDTFHWLLTKAGLKQ